MQDSGRFSGGADLRRAVNSIRKNPHEMLAAALRADPAFRDSRDARTLGRLRTDLAAFRADQARRLAVRDEAPVRRRERRGAAPIGPCKAASGRFGRQRVLSVRFPVQFIAELAFSCGVVVALVMFANTFGASFVAAIAGPQVP